MSTVSLLFRRAVGRQQQSAGRFVDPHLFELVADENRLVIARDAQLAVAGEVDEDAEDREHFFVLGPLRTQRQRIGLRTGQRWIGLVHRLDHATENAAVLVDVVHEHLRNRLLVAAREIDELCDRGVVDDRDAELDRVGADAVAEIGELLGGFRRFRFGCGRLAGFFARGVVVIVVAAASSDDERGGQHGRNHEAKRESVPGRPVHGNPPVGLVASRTLRAAPPHVAACPDSVRSMTHWELDRRGAVALATFTASAAQPHVDGRDDRIRGPPRERCR